MDTSPPTLRSWLLEWLATYVPRRCTAKSAERYTQLAGYVLDSRLAPLGLSQLTHHEIETWLFSLLTAKAVRRKHLGARSVRLIAGVLSVALEKASRLDLIAANPMRKVELPRMCEPDARSLSLDEIQALRNACRGDWTSLLVELALATGCRRGELLALGWADVDWASGVLRVAKSLEQTKAGLRVKSPKSGRSRRCTLPEVALAPLRLLRDRAPLARLVFPDELGAHRSPALVSQAVIRRFRRAGIDDASLHTLRHTHASTLISRGVPLPAVSVRLGHADCVITARIYCHALPLDDQRAAAEWDRVMAITA